MRLRNNVIAIVLLLASVSCADTKVTAETPTIPILINRPDNMVMRISIDGPGMLDRIVLCTAGTTDLNDIGSIKLLCAGNDQPTSVKPDYYQFGPARKAADIITFNGPLELTRGKNNFVVSCTMNPNVNLLNYLSFSCVYASIDGKTIRPNNLGTDKLRLGVKVRHNGDDGSKGYRIPGMVTTNEGTILATYDVRYHSRRDLQGHMDIGLSRSTDHGRTWQPMRTILDMKQWGGLNEKYNGVSDAGILVDRNTSRIFAFGCWMHGLRDKEGQFRTDLTESSNDWAHQWHRGCVGSGPGMTPKQTAQFVMAYSDDDGKTWSSPVNITKQVKRNPDWYLFAPAPGSGITLSDGTLVLPSQGRDENQNIFSNIIFSKDHGKTWQCSDTVSPGTNECAVIELENGSILLNGRDSAKRSGARGVVTTPDLGKTWKKHPTDRNALIEPTCMASMIEHTHKYKGKKILLFSNPDSRKRRHRMTIKGSFDDGMTWKNENQLLLDEFGGAYSCLTSVDKDTVGIFYESSQGDLIFQKINIKDIL